MRKLTGRRRMAPVLVLVLSGMLVVTEPGTQADYGAPKHSHEGPPCSLRGSTSLYQDTVVRVYSKRDAADNLNRYACLYPAAKRRLIFQTPADATGHLTYVQRQGHRIAFWDHGEGRCCDTWSYVCVFDARSGKLRCSAAFDAVNGVGLTPGGSIAWLEAPTELTGRTSYVRKWDAGARQSVILYSGADIDPTSFAVGGRHIYWIKAGSPQSASMP
jgi:hypothetical protein